MSRRGSEGLDARVRDTMEWGCGQWKRAGTDEWGKWGREPTTWNMVQDCEAGT